MDEPDDNGHAILNVIDEQARAEVDALLRESAGRVGFADADRLAFEKRLDVRWQYPLELLRLFHLELIECGTWYELQAPETEEAPGPMRHAALSGLGRRVNRTMGEVIALLRAGYPDGANARVRTLHELAVTCLVLGESDEALAKRYLDHADVDSHKAAVQLREHREHLAPADQMSDDEIRELAARQHQLLEEHGRGFDLDHGWAIPALPETAQKRPRFKDLEELAQRTCERPYYKLACLNVHADPRSLFSSIGLPPDLKGVVSGASDAGLALPGHLAALYCYEAFEAIMLSAPCAESFLRSMMLAHLSTKVGEVFEEGEEAFLLGRAERLREEETAEADRESRTGQ